jgi:hypothetical protein
LLGRSLPLEPLCQPYLYYLIHSVEKKWGLQRLKSCVYQSQSLNHFHLARPLLFLSVCSFILLCGVGDRNQGSHLLGAPSPTEPRPSPWLDLFCSPSLLAPPPRPGCCSCSFNSSPLI